MTTTTYTTKDVAERLKLTDRAVRDMCKRGEIRGMMFGRVWRIHPDDLEAFIRAKREAAKLWLRKQRACKSYDDMRTKVGKHIERSDLGEQLLEHVTAAVIDDYLTGLESDDEHPATPATANRLRSMFSGIYRHLDERGLWHGQNPARKVKQRKEPMRDERRLAPELVSLLLEHAPDDAWRTVFAIAAYTGMRRGEIRALSWDDVDVERRIITVAQSKTGVVRKVGIHRQLVPILKDAKKRGLALDDRTWQKAAKRVRAALKAAGAASTTACFKALRSAWATQLVECGARADVVEYMGWGPRRSSVFRKHYLDFPASRLVAEVDRLRWPKAQKRERRLPYAAR